VFGSRSARTGKKLWDLIKTNEIEQVMTDYWKPYTNFIPKEIHKQSKKETYTVEGYNSLLRDQLARLRRKTKCYTKSVEMLWYSVALCMAKKNNMLLPLLR
jgi:insertion element IS1 protein InsB